jgi:5-methylcytosine-specific restriction endonuclease McrA
MNCSKCNKEFKNTQGLSMHEKYCGRRKTTFTCKQCGKESEAKHSSTNQYCGLECYHVASRVVKDEHWYKRHRAIANEAWVRYNLKQKEQTPPDADLKLIQKIYMECPEGYEVDHIIPISKGGLHHQDNLQYLPWKENRRKGNKII